MMLSYGQVTRRQVIAGLIGCGVWGRLHGAGAETYSIPHRKPKTTPRTDAENAAWLTLPPTPELPGTSRQGRVAVNGASIFYAQFGDGPSVLLLHGGLANSSYWGYQIKELAQKYLVTVMDTRGHGRSPLTSNSFNYRLFAEDVCGLLDYLKIDKGAIIGWSDGAITGLQLAVTKPNRVSRLFAFGANSSLDGLKPNGARSSVFKSFVERCQTEYTLLSPHPERWSQLVAGLRLMWRTQPNFDKRELATVGLPTTISDGEYDEIIKLNHTKKIALDVPKSRLVILPEVSHFAMLQNPSQFTKALFEFLTAEN